MLEDNIKIIGTKGEYKDFPYRKELYLYAIHISFTGITVLRFDSTPGSLAMPVLELLNDDRHLIKE